MLLAIDVGNSHTVSGVFQDDRLLFHWRLKTDRKKTADELAANYHSLFSMNDIEFKDITAVIIATVVPTQQLSWLDFTKNMGWPTLVVNTKSIRIGMNILTDRPEEVGADRLANAIAAYARYKMALIIVDFGTAVTFDCVSKNGEYIGGAITPGIAISLDALSSHTAKLPRVDISSPPGKIIGKNTEDAIKSGILYGYGGMVDGLVTRLKSEFGTNQPKVVATGGMAALVAPYAACIESLEPKLTLEGLRIIYERNR